MKFFTFLLFLLPFLGISQGTESFDNATTLPTGSTYGDGNFTGDGSIVWNYIHCQDALAYPITGNGVLLRRSNEPSSISATLSGGVGSITVDTRKGYSSNTQRKIELVINGSVVDQFEPVYPSGESSTVVPWTVSNINTAGSVDIEFRLYGATGNQHIVLDNISWTGYTSGTCNITASGITALTCNDNATGAIPADDYLTFNLNPTGSTLGTNYNVTVSSGTVTPTTGTYGAATSFQLQAGSAGAGDVTLTITDDTDGGCTINQVITDPGVCSSATPVITLTPSTLTGFDHMVGTTSAEQTFTASGISLAADIVLTAPTGFEISTTTGTGFTNMINLAPVTGTVAATTIYVRGNAAAIGTISGDITGTSTGAIDKAVAVSGYADDYVYYTIDQVTTNDANGVADSIGVYVWLTGVTHCIDFDGNAGLSFTLIDASTKGINVFNFNDVNDYVVTEGDSLKVRGQIAQYNGLTQLTVDSIEVLSQGVDLQIPTIVTVLDEAVESQVITLENLTLVTPMATFAAGSSNVNVTDGTNVFVMRIDADTDIPGAAAPQVSFSVTGIGTQFDSSSPYTEGYQILPCGLGSIVPSCTMPDLTVAIVNDAIEAAATGVTYQWIDCSTNDEISGENGMSFTPTVTGNYAVIVTDGECSDTSVCVNMTIDISGINEMKYKSSIQLFPNPTNGIVTIQFEGTEATVFVTDLTGKLVEQTTIKSNESIDLSTLNSGTYLVNVELNGSISTERLTIK